ncbi:MAG: RNA 2',3'-cyclic phosphodiesterase [Ignisphaera sp.]|uniref:RNA 2',3'-cyclic phosphodiesterase n=1 Tax=Ignisphaera aggregans TaxID=334771 RepID=A0A832CC64_9CREN
MSIRCFVAIEVEDQRTLTEVLKIKHRLEDLDLDIKSVEDTDIHLTIRFLGHISLSSIEVIESVLQNIGQTMNRFEIEIRGFGAFPSINKPRVIWVGLSKGSEHLHNIRRILDNEIRRRNLRDVFEDQHEFSPHITLARVRSFKNIHLLYDLFKQYSDYIFGQSIVTKIKLKQSILTPQGPIYRDLFITDLR